MTQLLFITRTEYHTEICTPGWRWPLHRPGALAALPEDLGLFPSPSRGGLQSSQTLVPRDSMPCLLRAPDRSVVYIYTCTHKVKINLRIRAKGNFSAYWLAGLK